MMKNYRMKHSILISISLILIILSLCTSIYGISEEQTPHKESTFSVCLVIIDLGNKGLLIIDKTSEVEGIFATKFIIKPTHCWKSIDEVASGVYKTLQGLMNRLVNIESQDLEIMMKSIINSIKNTTSIQGNIVIEVKFENGSWKAAIYPLESFISIAKCSSMITISTTIASPTGAPFSQMSQTKITPSPTLRTKTEKEMRSIATTPSLSQRAYGVSGTSQTQTPVPHINRYIALGIASLVAIIIYFITMRILSRSST